MFHVIYPLLCSGVLFYLLTAGNRRWRAPIRSSTGQFLAFYAAFGSLLAAGLGLLGAVLRVVGDASPCTSGRAPS